MKKLLSAAMIAFSTFTAFITTPASANEIPILSLSESKTPFTGIKMCLKSKAQNISLVPLTEYVESAVLILNEAGTPIIKANNYFTGPSPAGYWTSKLPRVVDLDAGCYYIYFMLKPTPPGTSEWSCAWVQATTTLTTAAKTRVTTLSGSAGGSYPTHVMLFPGEPETNAVGQTDCWRGY
ncbi:MAG TPA: hypothetical protein PKZ97_06165 [Azospirillaceae bacterium]|nr:hypothetical protein [Azospirillaceae bacterium]